MNKDSKIFIAGARGMVGSAILRELEKLSFTNILTPTSKDLNILNQADVESFFLENKPDYVFNAAAKVGGIYANDFYSADFIYENIQIQTNLIHFAMKNKVKKFLFMASSCIYPRQAPQPIKESHLLSDYLEETNEAYAIAKISGIKMLEHYKKGHNFDSISLMPCNLYGYNDNYNLETSHVFPALIRKFVDAKINNSSSVEVWGTGKVYREFMHVDDVAKAAIFFINKDIDESLINIGWGKEISIIDLVELIKKRTNFKGDIVWNGSKKDGTIHKRLDIDKMSGYGFNPSIDLVQGIDTTIESYCIEQLNKSFKSLIR
jgi:GDP-L-fucose synthase